LKERLKETGADELFRIHFAAAEGTDLPLFRYISKVFTQGAEIRGNFADPDVKAVHDLQRRLNKEACRVAQFIRFSKTADDIYFASYAPEYNVIPMVLHHFGDRFADQRWMIYDVKRQKGYFHDGNEIQWVTLVSNSVDLRTGDLPASKLSPDELLFQQLWREYFSSICIAERINLKLHMQKIPKRYWRFLTEKKVNITGISEKKVDL
jgi:probable DNA metabolism protein